LEFLGEFRVLPHELSEEGDARNLGTEHLLPEERALIAPLLAD
jgi:hypothetical protein